MPLKIPKSEPRKWEQLIHHYEIEKRLAGRLLHSTKEERTHLYPILYNELFIKVPDHPQLRRKYSIEESKGMVSLRMRFLERFLNKNITFLEIGAGDCALSLEVAKLVEKVFAVDVSEEITKGLDYPINFKFILSNGFSLNIPENSIDVVYCNQVLEHFHPDDVVEQLQIIYNVLVPGGVFISITPNRLNGPHDISIYFDRVSTGFHLKEYTTTELHYLLKSVGFSKVKAFVAVRGFYLNFPLRPIKLLEKLLILLPYFIRRMIACNIPARILLSNNLIGIK